MRILLFNAVPAKQNIYVWLWMRQLTQIKMLRNFSQRGLFKYSREGKHLNPNPIPKPFRIFFWNCRGLSITFTSKSRQKANANLYYVTKFPLYLSVTVLSWCHHWFPREKVSEKRAQKFHSDDSSLPRAPGTWLTYPSPSPQTLLTLLCDPY